MKISQREAHRLKRRIAELEGIQRKQRNLWWSDWPSGIVLSRLKVSDSTYAEIKTARKLKHAVVVTVENDNTIAFFAAAL